MGRALAGAFPAARAVFEAADDALGWSLSKACFEGPDDVLVKTEVTQPAILTTSVAAFAALRAEAPDLSFTCMAGHSLGEWSALVATGALDFQDAVRLVQTRGQLMQEAMPEGEGAMLAVIGLAPEAIRSICQEVATETDTVLGPANYNSPEQTVVSGHRTAADLAEGRFKEAGAKKVVPLAVSAPFHSPLMKPAADGLAEALKETPVGALSAPVVTNVEAAPNTDPERVLPLLVEQVTAPVRWVEIVQAMAHGGEKLMLEVGPGTVLKGLARRIDRSVSVHAVGDPATLEKALTALVS